MFKYLQGLNKYSYLIPTLFLCLAMSDGGAKWLISRLPTLEHSQRMAEKVKF
jgi:hypothetical protein